MEKNTKIDPTQDYLFVYGTLLSAIGHPVGNFLRSNTTFVGIGVTQGQLYDLGEYPGLIVNINIKNQVSGEIYQLENHTVLSQIDQYEGISQYTNSNDEYSRQKVLVKMEKQTDIMAWTYIYVRSLTDKAKIISGDYLSYLRLK